MRLPYERLTLCVAAGLLQALSAGWTVASKEQASLLFEHPLLIEGSWALQVLAVGLFCACLSFKSLVSRRDAVLLSAAFGLSWQSAGLWWLFIGMHTYAGLSAPLAALAVLALAAYLALYTVLSTLAFQVTCQAFVSRRGAASFSFILISAAAFAGAWLLAEMGRAMVMTGFPWAASGYAHLDGPVRLLLPWLGVYGGAAVAAGLCAFLVQGVLCNAVATTSRIAAMGLALAATSLLAWLPERDFTKPAGDFDVKLLQGNVSQDSKFKEEHIARALNWYTHELGRSHADLAMTPETALPVLIDHIPRAYWERLELRVRDQPGVLLAGVPHVIASGTHSNTMVGLAHANTWVDLPAGSLYRYDKQHLVPFAEFTPWGFGWFTRLLNLPLPSFDTVPGDNRPLRIRTRAGDIQTIAMLICFEDLFAEDFAPLFRDLANAPTAMANASNLAWFDDSPAMAQHLRFAQARSLEFQRPTFRASNTGPTVVINHHGQITRALEPGRVGVLNAVVEGRTGITPYAYWLSRWGLWPLVLLAVLLIALPLTLRKRSD